MPKLKALREAAASEQEEARNSDALASDRAQLLEQGLDFHDVHGDQQCPVCGQGSLDERWAVAARAALERERSATRTLNAARAATAQARSAVVTLIRGVARPPRADDDLTTLVAAQQAWEHFAQYPDGDDVALVEHVEAALPELERSYAALREQASGLIQQRADEWAPVAEKLADWMGKARAVAKSAPQLKLTDEALKWLRENAGELRNERITPLADQARHIWAELRQESNVDLGAIRLEGQNTSRRVTFDAEDKHAVDKWLSAGSTRKQTMAVVNKGLHQGAYKPKGAVNDARRTVAELAKVGK